MHGCFRFNRHAWATVVAVTSILVAGCASDAASREATPAQPEGPYYPLEKPVDRDSDLTRVDGQDRVAAGEVLTLGGSLVDTAGDPVSGATIEIWQTDTNGIYLHPDDPEIGSRDQAFQGYGEAAADSNGEWTFTTVNPGRYEPRPRHIHVKVIVGGNAVLTTQIYFSDDPDAGEDNKALVADVERGGDGSLTAMHLLVVEP
ncbi:MAG: intradiol ring-cleavage dioxygenase [Acidimicrobiia bacterium]